MSELTVREAQIAGLRRLLAKKDEEIERLRLALDAKDALLAAQRMESDDWIAQKDAEIERLHDVAKEAVHHDHTLHVEVSDEGTSYCRMCEALARLEKP